MLQHKTTGYDGDLQMFIEPPRGTDVARLRFLRWLSERGLLEHVSVGAASGKYADAATLTEHRATP